MRNGVVTPIDICHGSAGGSRVESAAARLLGFNFSSSNDGSGFLLFFFFYFPFIYDIFFDDDDTDSSFNFYRFDVSFLYN